MRPLAAFVVVSCAASAFAQEHVLFEVQGKETLSGTIRPPDEREAILCRLARGSVLKAVAKSIDKAGPVPAIELIENGDPVGGVQTVVKGRGVSLVPVAVPKSALYKLVVRGDGALDGDYQVVVSWKPQKKFTGTGTSAGETTFDFAAPPHATVGVTLKAAAGSAFVPRLVSLDGPNGASIALTGGGKAKAVPLTARGDWSVRFATDGAEGAYTISVTVAAPAPKKHTFDIRDGSLSGKFSDGQDVVAAVVEPDDGGNVGVTDPGSPIAGSSVEIPRGALGKATSIFVAESAPYTPPGDDVPAGPAVEFGPSGTQFDPAIPAKVTIPFDAADFPGGTDALVVYVKDAEGNVEPVLPTSSYVFGTGTVTFTTSHFSVFQAATSAPRGPLSGDYTLVETFGSPSSFYGGDSGVGVGAAFFTGNGADFLTSRTSVQFESGLNPAGPGPPTVALGFPGGDFRANVEQIGDSRFDLTDPDTMAPLGVVRRGVSNDVLVMEHLPNSFTLGSKLLLKRVDARPTLNALAGRWHVLVWEVSANVPAAGDTTLPLFVTAETGGAVIDGAGTIAFKMTGGVKRFSDFPGGIWNTETFGRRSAAGNLKIDPDFIPVLDFGDDESIVGFSVCAGGDVLVGKMENFDRGFGRTDVQTGLMFLVRESSGAAASDLAGSFLDLVGGVDLETDGSNPLGLDWRAQRGVGALDAELGIVRTYTECLSGYLDDQADPSTTSRDVNDIQRVKFTLSPAGVFAAPLFGLQGAALRNGSLLIYLERRAPTLGLGFMVRILPTRI